MIEFYDVFKEVVEEIGLPDGIKKINDHIYSKRKPLSEIKSLFETNGF